MIVPASSRTRTPSWFSKIASPTPRTVTGLRTVPKSVGSTIWRRSGFGCSQAHNHHRPIPMSEILRRRVTTPLIMPSFRMTGTYAGRQSKVTTGSTVHHGRPILDGALVLQRRAVGDGLFGLDAGRADTYQGVLYLALVDRSVHQVI